MPRAVNIACEPSNVSVSESNVNENQERIDGGANDGSAIVSPYRARSRNRVNDPARDISIQVLEKFSLVTRFARETTSQLFSENQVNGFGAIERRAIEEEPLHHPVTSSNAGEKIADESPVPPDPLEVSKPSFF